MKYNFKHRNHTFYTCMFYRSLNNICLDLYGSWQSRLFVNTMIECTVQYRITSIQAYISKHLYRSIKGQLTSRDLLRQYASFRSLFPTLQNYLERFLSRMPFDIALYSYATTSITLDDFDMVWRVMECSLGIQLRRFNNQYFLSSVFKIDLHLYRLVNSGEPYMQNYI